MRQWLHSERDLPKLWAGRLLRRSDSLTSTTALAHLSSRKSLFLCTGGFADSSVRVYALGGSSERETDGSVGDGGDGSKRLWGHTAPVYGVDFSHDGQLLFSASGDGCASRVSKSSLQALVRHGSFEAWTAAEQCFPFWLYCLSIMNVVATLLQPSPCLHTCRSPTCCWQALRFCAVLPLPTAVQLGIGFLLFALAVVRSQNHAAVEPGSGRELCGVPRPPVPCVGRGRVPRRPLRCDRFRRSHCACVVHGKDAVATHPSRRVLNISDGGPLLCCTTEAHTVVAAGLQILHWSTCSVCQSVEVCSLDRATVSCKCSVWTRQPCDLSRDRPCALLRNRRT